MNTSQPDSTHDRVWQGKPWTDNMTSLLDRPCDVTRAAIYAAARAALPAAQPLHARAWQIVFGRETMSFAAWAACACIVFSVCVWQTPVGHQAAVQDTGVADVRAFADDLEQMSHASLVSENNGTDIDDIVFVDQIQYVSQSLVALADDLEL